MRRRDFIALFGEHRFPAEQPDRFCAFAQEFVESKVDAIIAVTALGAMEAKRPPTRFQLYLFSIPIPSVAGLSKVWHAAVATPPAFHRCQLTYPASV